MAENDATGQERSYSERRMMQKQSYESLHDQGSEGTVKGRRTGIMYANTAGGVTSQALRNMERVSRVVSSGARGIKVHAGMPFGGILRPLCSAGQNRVGYAEGDWNETEDDITCRACLKRLTKPV